MMRVAAALCLSVFLAPSPAGAGTPRHAVSSGEAATLSPAARAVIAGLQYLLNAQQVRQYLSLASDEERAE